MKKLTIYSLINYLIASIWFINGLFCKVLNLVPRHQLIVSDILALENARILTLLIGISEIGMCFWILSKIKARLNAMIQIGIILLMNILEFIFSPDLLLYGRFNIFLAILLSVIIYLNEFYIKPTDKPVLR